jgi:hypothetical protein
MTVAASIILAALVGGVVFVLLDSWQRRSAEPAPGPAWAPEPRTEPLPPWTPEARTEPLPEPPPHRPLWDDPPREDPPPPGLWSGWARH